jgi:hypothetical protein
MTRAILELVDDKIDTSGILLMTKLTKKNSAFDKIARPYFHFSLISQFDVITISALSHADIQVSGCWVGLQ